ncbi:MAG: ComEA family DNA-binding protein [Acidimicrobiia bacterium]|nr:ComEA family DNA-binding protein [Acidimicrobiia bacterium]
MAVRSPVGADPDVDLDTDFGPEPDLGTDPDPDPDAEDRRLQAAFSDPPRGLIAVLEPWVGGAFARPGVSLVGVGISVALVVVGVLLLRGAPPPPPDPTLPMAGASTPMVGGAGEQAAGTGETPGDGPSSRHLTSSTGGATGSPDDLTGGPADDPVVAHVAGAVHRPGLHVLDPGARVAELVEAAGGATPDADLDRINLAAPVPDGARLYVPTLGQVELPAEVAPSLSPHGGSSGSGPAGTSSGGAGGGGTGAPVAVNVADVAELERLPGVGPATAQAIVDHRSAHGPFATVEDLLAVRGIGDAKLAALRDHVVL